MDIATLLIQIPIVGIFVWFVVQNNREWRTYLSERNSKLESCLIRNADALEKLGSIQERSNRILLRYFASNEVTKEDLEKLVNS